MHIRNYFQFWSVFSKKKPTCLRVNVTDTILWQGHHDRVMQLIGIYFCGICQMMPLKVWPNTALGCNRQSICMPQLQTLCAAALEVVLTTTETEIHILLTPEMQNQQYLLWFDETCIHKFKENYLTKIKSYPGRNKCSVPLRHTPSVGSWTTRMCWVSSSSRPDIEFRPDREVRTSLSSCLGRKPHSVFQRNNSLAP